MRNRIRRSNIPLKDTLVVKKSKIHDQGVYAKRDIAEGEHIIRYLGKRLTSKQANVKTCDDTYHYQISKRYTIDGKNDARYINHSCDPSCESDVIRGVIWIIAIRKIKAGEELTYNYGFNAKESQDYPCRCAARNCIGYIADDVYWDKIKRMK